MSVKYVVVSIKNGILNGVIGFNNLEEAVQNAKMNFDCEYSGVWKVEERSGLLISAFSHGKKICCEEDK